MPPAPCDCRTAQRGCAGLRVAQAQDADQAFTILLKFVSGSCGIWESARCCEDDGDMMLSAALDAALTFSKSRTMPDSAISFCTSGVICTPPALRTCCCTSIGSSSHFTAIETL